MRGWPSGFRTNQPDAKSNRYPTRDFVLQSKRIVCVVVESFGPEMRVCLRIDQLGVNADPVAQSADAPLQHISHAQLAPDLLRVERPVPIGERGIAGDHQHVLQPREISR
jgi:hypothetical protein